MRKEVAKIFNWVLTKNKTASLKAAFMSPFLFLAMLAVGLFAPQGASAASIATCSDLQGMSLSGNHTLTQDVECSGFNFIPIGGIFTGTLDGAGFKIMNLTINQPGVFNVGLFKKISNVLLQPPRVTNLILEDLEVVGGHKTGGLAAEIVRGLGGCNGTTDPVNICPVIIDNVHITSTANNRSTITGASRVGGMVGSSTGGNIYNATVDADVGSTDPNANVIGGLLAELVGGFVKDSFTSGQVSGHKDVGGLIGGGNAPVGGQGHSLRSGSSATVTGTNNDSVGIGGLVGRWGAGTIKESFATGNVSGRSMIGGLVGESRVAITDSYATGSVTGTTSQIGGLIGRAVSGGSVNCAYATGGVSAVFGQAGGLIGRAEASGATYSNSYATGNVTSTHLNFVAGFIGLKSTGTLSNSFWSNNQANCTSAGIPSGCAFVADPTDFESLSNAPLSACDDSIWASAAGGACLLWQEGCGAPTDPPPPPPTLISQCNDTFGTPPAAGMIGYWHFDDPIEGADPIDAYGGNNGTPVGDSTGTFPNCGEPFLVSCPGPTGEVGQVPNATDGALRWVRNKNDYIKIPDADSLDFGTGDFSVAAWVKFSQVSQTINFYALITKKDENGSPKIKPGWAIYLGGGRVLQARIADGTNVAETDAGSGGFVLDDNEFHFITVVFDRNGNTIKNYVDGVPDGATADISNVTGSVDNADDVWFGRRKRDGSDGFLQGTMDEIAFFNRVLTPTEIQAMYDKSNDPSNEAYCETDATPPPPPSNIAPTANAGADQTVCNGANVLLSGSGSDDDGDSLTYQWSQLGGSAQTLDNDTSASTSFTADVLAPEETLTFSLVADDGIDSSDPLDELSLVEITVKVDGNNAPTADAGEPQSVTETAGIVILDGSGSFDDDSDPIVSYSWVQTAGTTVTLQDAGTVSPSFSDLPSVGSGMEEILTFELIVCDQPSDTCDIARCSAASSVNITITNVNNAPNCVASADAILVNEGVLVNLSGSASDDTDGDSLTYSWSPGELLNDASSATPSFTAPPQEHGGQETLIFTLTVDDGFGGSDSCDVSVTVLDVNAPPDCLNAAASPDNLWPPNHKFSSVSIIVSDADDTPSITIDGVSQDEELNATGKGDGNTSPDAIIGDGSVQLRAERDGKGNGRCYYIDFTAADDHGGSCSGTVETCVNHSKKKAAVGEGPLHDSTQ